MECKFDNIGKESMFSKTEITELIEFTRKLVA